MKTGKGKFLNSGLWMFVVTLICSMLGITGVEGAVSASGTPLYGETMSLEQANEHAPDIVRATIEREVVMIRPHLAPLYSIAANHGREQKGTNPLIEWHEIEAQGLATEVATAFAGGGAVQGAIDLVDNKLIAINQTLFFKGINGYKEGGTVADGWFVAYVKDKDAAGLPIIVPINGVQAGTSDNTIPNIPAGTVVIRGARTASEKQSRTAPLTAVPSKKKQYMQKMILETQESTFFNFSTNGADVKWTKTELTDFAIFEHKMTAEADMLIGKMRKVQIQNKFNTGEEDTYFQEGIYWQAGRDHSLPINATPADLISMMKTIFVGNRSSNTKILLAGADVVEALSKVAYDQVIRPGRPGQVFGLDVQSVIYGQYNLLIVAEPAFDDLGMADKALVIDGAYLTKYQHNWRSIPLDNVKLGQSDTKSQVYIDTFGLVLSNANAHCRIELI